MKTAIKLVLIYFLMQLLAAVIAGPLSVLYVYFTYGTWDVDMSGKISLAPTMLLGFVFMGWYLWRKNYLKNDGHLYSSVSPSFLGWSVLAGVSSIFLISVLMEQLEFLPDWLKQTFDILQSGWLGILCVAILGPILEELLFRGAITKVLLQKYKPTTAILISGLVFGIFHINPVQVVGACFIGFLLAWLYYKTQSLIPCILLHILNNSLSVWIGLKYADTDTMSQLLGEPLYMVFLIASALLLLLSLKMLNNYKISDTNTITTTEL